MQNNKLALSLQETDVLAFLYEIYLSFSDVAEQKNMDFRFLPSVPSYKMFIDKGNLDKVCLLYTSFSTDQSLYFPAVLTRWEGIDCYNAHPLIYAYGESNIADFLHPVSNYQLSTNRISGYCET